MAQQVQPAFISHPVCIDEVMDVKMISDVINSDKKVLPLIGNMRKRSYKSKCSCLWTHIYIKNRGKKFYHLLINFFEFINITSGLPSFILGFIILDHIFIAIPGSHLCCNVSFVQKYCSDTFSIMHSLKITHLCPSCYNLQS